MVSRISVDQSVRLFDPMFKRKGAERSPWDIIESQEFLVGTSYSDVWDFQYGWDFLQVLLNVTASQTDVGDSATISLEMSSDNVLFHTVAVFEVVAGNASSPQTAVITFQQGLSVNPDAIFIMLGSGAGIVDEKATARYLRAKVIVAETNDAAHTLSLGGYIRFKNEGWGRGAKN